MCKEDDPIGSYRSRGRVNLWRRDKMDSITERHEKALRRAEASITVGKEQAAKDVKRMRYHLMAPAYWINDPCGLIQFQGDYHVFYQHNPYGPLWGMMHWGHARSKDLIHWEHLPIALAPSEDYDSDPQGGIFTGSAVVDQGTLKVFYCGSTGEGENTRQVQCLAVSSDGIHFEKYCQNPVISVPPPEGSKDFRDPNVWKHGDHWYMVVGSGKDGKGKALLYRSDDLEDWDYIGVMAQSDGTLGTMWECPDFFPLGEKYVLIFSPMGLGKVKGLYLVGDFDDVTGKFTWQTKGEIDYGCDYYAPQTMEDDKHRRIMFGWLNSWGWMPWFKGFGPTVADNWCGAISLPRVLRLDEENHLCCEPALETKKLRGEQFCWKDVVVDPENRLMDHKADGVCLEIILLFDLQKTTAREFGLVLRGNEETDQKTVIRYFPKTEELVFDRSASDPYSEGESRCHCPPEKDGKLFLQVFSDTSCVEIYANHGRFCMSNNIYPDPSCVGTELYAKEGNLFADSVDVWRLKSIW